MTTDSGVMAYVDQLFALAQELHPGESHDWYAAWLARMLHYALNDGDMTDAPDMPA